MHRITVVVGLLVLSITPFKTEATSSSVLRYYGRPGHIDYDDDFDVCSRNRNNGSLQLKSSKSDVVITGTILNLMREDSLSLLDEAFSEVAQRRSGRTLSALVKVWSVMKGSLGDITDKSKKYRRFKRSAKKHSPSDEQLEPAAKSGAKITEKLVNTAAKTDSGLTNQIVELHGLWNSYFCESFLHEGDTRVFFLKKMPDRRSSLKREKRSSKRQKKRKRKCKGKRRKANKFCKKRSTKMGRKNISEVRLNNSREPFRRTGMISKSRSSSTNSQLNLLIVQDEPSRITLANLNKIKSANSA